MLLLDAFFIVDERCADNHAVHHIDTLIENHHVDTVDVFMVDVFMRALSRFSWRLKVYPRGVEGGKGTHLSVFLELLDSPPDSIFSMQPEHLWRVMLIKRNIAPGTQTSGATTTTATATATATAADASVQQNHAREAVCTFGPGKCWGYATFYALEDLFKDG